MKIRTRLIKWTSRKPLNLFDLNIEVELWRWQNQVSECASITNAYSIQQRRLCWFSLGLSLCSPLLASELPPSLHPIQVQVFISSHCLTSFLPSSQFYIRHISSWYYMSIHLQKLLRRRQLVASKTLIFRIYIPVGSFSLPHGKSVRGRLNAHFVINNTHPLPEGMVWGMGGSEWGSWLRRVKAQEDFLPEMAKREWKHINQDNYLYQDGLPLWKKGFMIELF